MLAAAVSRRHFQQAARDLPACPPLHCPHTLPLSQIYSVESHRLALALDRRGALVQIVRSAILQVCRRGQGGCRCGGLGQQQPGATCTARSCRRIHLFAHSHHPLPLPACGTVPQAMGLTNPEGIRLANLF